MSTRGKKNKTNNKRKANRVSANTERSSPSLLRRMRLDRSCSYAELDDFETQALLIQHQSEFPSKIREEIEKAAPTIRRPTGFEYPFCTRIERAVVQLLAPPEPGAPWNGLDSAIDTQDEVEVALRFFPNVLGFSGFSFFDGVVSYMRESALFAVSVNPKSLPFAPLIAELGFEIFPECHRSNFLNSILRYQTTDDEYAEKLDEATLAVLMRLKDKGFLKIGDDENSHFSSVAMELRPTRIDKTFKFLLEWDPNILMGNFVDTFPLICVAHQCNTYIGQELTFKRFKMFLELGMEHYPGQMGFLFHIMPYNEGDSCAFYHMIRLCGNERVTQAVEEVLLKTTDGKPKTWLRNLVIFMVASKDTMVMDSWYLLFRLRPAIFGSGNFDTKEEQALHIRRTMGRATS